MTPAHFDRDELDEGSDTPPTRSYVDALLKGNMTALQIASLRAEIAHEPELADYVDQLAPQSSQAPPVPLRATYASSVPPRAPTSRTTGLRPPEPPPLPDEDDVRTIFHAYASTRPGAPTPPHGLDAEENVDDGWSEAGAPSSQSPHSRPLVDLDLGDDDARTLMRLPGAFHSLPQRSRLAAPSPSPIAPEAAPPSVEALDETYLRALGGLAGVPQVAVAPGQLTQLPLGCQAAFVVSRLDGESSIDDLIDVSSLGRIETLRLLYELVQDGIVSIAPAR